MLREVRKQLGDHVDRRLEIGGDQAGRPGVAGVRRGAAELLVVDVDPCELGHHCRTGDERVRVGGHHDEVGDSEKQRRPGDSRAFHDHDDRDDPRAIGQRLCGESPAVQRGKAFDDVGAAGAHDDDQREALLPGGARRVLDLARGVRCQCADPRAGVDIHPNDLAAIEVADVGCHRADDSVAKGDGHHGRDCNYPA